jgi:hypothetical protein
MLPARSTLDPEPLPLEDREYAAGPLALSNAGRALTLRRREWTVFELLEGRAWHSGSA